MKKRTFIYIVLAICMAQSIQGQDRLEEKLNVRLGLIGGWVSYDKPLGGPFLLNTELGYVGGIIGGNFLFTSILEIEPRYYYNIDKRIQKGKSVKNNSANYIAVHLSYLPDFLTSTKYKSTSIERSFNVIPTYGLRRNISGGLNFDFEIGLGYQINNGTGNNVVPNLGLGLSYSF